MKIYYITGNKSKFNEAKLILKGIALIRKDIKLEEIKSLNQEDVVLDKARKAFRKLGKPVIADDAGIYFEEYKNFPGTYTRFLFESIGFRGIKNLLRGRKKKACFKVLICYKDKNHEEIFSGIWRGKITRLGKKYNPDWQYDSIFMPQNYKKTLSEIPLEERAKISHRKKAFVKLAKYLKKLKGGKRK
jgi:XTP/dITP diphosphohydrolase